MLPSTASAQLVVFRDSLGVSPAVSPVKQPEQATKQPEQLRVDAAEAETETEYTVNGYFPDFPCPGCITAKRWNSDSLPFKIVWQEDKGHEIYKYVESLDNEGQAVGYPIFEFKKKNGNFFYMSGANKKKLVESWTLYADPKSGKPKRETIVVETGKSLICGCRGDNAGCCLCLMENVDGSRAKPCTCSKTAGSYHHVESTKPGNWNPSGATGEYYDFDKKKSFRPDEAQEEVAQKVVEKSEVCKRCGKVHK